MKPGGAISSDWMAAPKLTGMSFRGEDERVNIANPDHPIVRDLRQRVVDLEQQLREARTEADVLRQSRDLCLKLAAWGGRRVDGRVRDEH